MALAAVRPFTAGGRLGWVNGSRPSLRAYASKADMINSTVSSNKVTIWSKTYCPYCTSVKELLVRDLKLDCKILELDTMGNDGAEIQASLMGITGSKTVPQVFVGGKYIGGCTDTQALHGQQKLVPMLQAAGVKVAA